MKRTALDDAAVLALEFGKGVVGTLVTSYVAPPTVRIEVIGTGAGHRTTSMVGGFEVVAVMEAAIAAAANGGSGNVEVEDVSAG